MKDVFVKLAICLLLTGVSLVGCSDFDEMKSQRLLIQAEALMEAGEEEQAIVSLTELIEKFPATHSGSTAQKHLALILKQKERRERLEFSKILDSFQQVLDGYQTLYAEYPRSIDDFEESGYFFDAEYLEEVTPAKFQVYLWLRNDGSGYRVWCVNEEREEGYAADSAGRRMVSFDRDEIISKLKKQFNTATTSQKLVVLQ